MPRKKAKKSTVEESEKAEDSTVEVEETAKVEDSAVEVKPRQKYYYVCAGRSITSKKGLLESGIQVHDNYFAGGKQSIDRLLKKGTIELR